MLGVGTDEMRTGPRQKTHRDIEKRRDKKRRDKKREEGWRRSPVQRVPRVVLPVDDLGQLFR
jgi:hypothetical protein